MVVFRLVFRSVSARVSLRTKIGAENAVRVTDGPLYSMRLFTHCVFQLSTDLNLPPPLPSQVLSRRRESELARWALNKDDTMKLYVSSIIRFLYYQTLEGSFSAVSKPMFASKY